MAAFEKKEQIVSVELLNTGNFRTLMTPLLSFIVLVILIAVAYVFGFSKLQMQYENLKVARKNKAILEEKISYLSEISSDVTSQSPEVVSALPAASPVLVVLSQLNNLSSGNSVAITNYSASGTSVREEGVTSYAAEFNVTGPTSNVFEFLLALKTLAPIISLNEIGATLQGNEFNASVSISSYSAPYPAFITSIEDPIDKLTNTEEATLANVLTLVKPFVLNTESLPPSTVTPRSNPFSTDQFVEQSVVVVEEPTP